jgi:hypothetical protein
MDKKAENMLKKSAGFLASREKDGKISSCSSECTEFSQYPQVCGNYPWSLKPGLEVLLLHP